MNLIPFLVKLVISSGLLYGYYHFFLRNRRFHHYNRFYLLAIALLSVVIPFVYIPVDFRGGQQAPVLLQTLRVINVNGWEEPVIIYAAKTGLAKWLNWHTGLLALYTAGLITGSFLLLRSLMYIRRIRGEYPFDTIDRLKIYQTREPGTPFSFFHSIFWDRKTAISSEQGQQILRHELFHVREKHSADILLMEILCCIAWFNPFFHLIKKEARAIHEFLADEYAASTSNRYDYAELLLLHAIKQNSPALTHPFFHNQIKRRITMITQSNLVRRSGYISRMMAMPILFVLVSAFAVKFTHQPFPSSTKYASKNITVVIDAGHGGIFPGTISNGKIAEKDITLSIARKIKMLAPGFNINVVLTRDNDALVGNAKDLKEDLLNRVAIAKNADAAAFVSIHVNSTVSPNTDSTGIEAWISGKKDDAKAKQLASTLLTSLKNTYATNQTIQQREVGVQVLDHNSCPAVLLECGFITNPSDLAFISNAANQEKIASKILEGIVQYSNAQNSNSTAYEREQKNGDTISAQVLSKLNPDDIKSVNIDSRKNLVTIYLKNGATKYAYAKQVNDYYAARHIDGELKGYRTNINMKDSVADIIFTKDTIPTGNKGKGIVFTKVEFEADYPGGPAGWIKYLKEHLNYPEAAQKKNIQGTVLTEFIVNTDGTVTDVKAISGPELLKAQSVKVIKESGVWIPAQQNGKKVRAYKRQPITYRLA
jgi:TonB family protein